MSSKRMFGASTSTTATILILSLISGGCYLKCQQSEYELGKQCGQLCPAGRFVIRGCTQSESTICTSCTEGTYMNQPTGAIACPDCTNCDADSGLKTKTLCTRTSDTVCEPLEGFHCVDSTDGGCRAAETHSSCRPGQFISRKGTALSDTVCSNCPEGTFSNGTLTFCQPHINNYRSCTSILHQKEEIWPQRNWNRRGAKGHVKLDTEQHNDHRPHQ